MVNGKTTLCVSLLETKECMRACVSRGRDSDFPWPVVDKANTVTIPTPLDHLVFSSSSSPLSSWMWLSFSEYMFFLSFYWPQSVSEKPAPSSDIFVKKSREKWPLHIRSWFIPQLLAQFPSFIDPLPVREMNKYLRNQSWTSDIASMVFMCEGWERERNYDSVRLSSAEIRANDKDGGGGEHRKRRRRRRVHQVMTRNSERSTSQATGTVNDD